VPVKPSWAWRLPEALEVLRNCPDEWIDRRRVEELFGCSKTVAWRILRHCSIQPGPAGALVCRREELLARLSEVASGGGGVEHEMHRMLRVEALLDQIRPEVIANLTRVVREDQGLALVNSRFGNLPAHVTLTPTTLHIDFQGTEDFLQAVGTIVFALNNDYEAISGFIEGTLPRQKRMTSEV
jgi:hypothetical protein